MGQGESNRQPHQDGDLAAHVVDVVLLLQLALGNRLARCLLARLFVRH
jgi:hypothetical protein